MSAKMPALMPAEEAYTKLDAQDDMIRQAHYDVPVCTHGGLALAAAPQAMPALTTIHVATEVIEHKPVLIVDTIVSAVSSARRKVTDVTFAPRFEQMPTGTILASPDMLNRAITDLLVTAARRTPSGGQVKVNISQGPGQIAIDIVAQGKKLAPGDLGSFFDIVGQRAMHIGGADFSLAPALALRCLRFFKGTASVRNGSTEGIVIEVRLPLESS